MVDNIKIIGLILGVVFVCLAPTFDPVLEFVQLVFRVVFGGGGLIFLMFVFYTDKKTSKELEKESKERELRFTKQMEIDSRQRALLENIIPNNIDTLILKKRNFIPRGTNNPKDRDKWDRELGAFLKGNGITKAKYITTANKLINSFEKGYPVPEIEFSHNMKVLSTNIFALIY